MASRKETQKSEKQVAVNGHAANGNGKSPSPIADLMRVIGGTGRFDPIPPDQHRWQGRKTEPQRHRMWSWMIAHTVAQRIKAGQSEMRVGSPFAVNEFGHELHLNDMAKDLGMDAANVRFDWRLYRDKLWRNGTKDEGEQRLYLLANVGDLPDEKMAVQKGENAEKVCADLFPPFIFKKLKAAQLPPDKLQEVSTGWKQLAELDLELRAACSAAARNFISQEQNNLLARYGVKHERQKHQRQGESEETAKERRGRGDVFLPAIETFVQTLRAEVCTESETPLHGPLNESAQTCIYKELEKTLERDRPNGRAENEPSARPQVVSQSPPHQNGNGKTEETWRPELREWLRENCPVKTSLDDVMFERIAFWLRPETVAQFQEAAKSVQNPRKWAVYEAVSKQVSERGEVVSEVPINRKDQRRQEWEREMYSKFGKEA